VLQDMANLNWFVFVCNFQSHNLIHSLGQNAQS
jgi:hypothetical protein